MAAPARLARWARFAAVGAGATAIDIGAFLALTRSPRAPLWLADVIALFLAATASYVLNRRITFAGDWHMRWVYEPAAFVAMALAAGAVDLVAVVVLAGVVVGGGVGALAGVKAAGMAAGALVRSTGYRRRLLRTVREHQMPIAGRPPPPGQVRFSVVVPTYHEAARIASTLDALRRALAPLALEGEAAGGVELVSGWEGARAVSLAQPTAASPAAATSTASRRRRAVPPMVFVVCFTRAPLCAGIEAF